MAEDCSSARSLTRVRGRFVSSEIALIVSLLDCLLMRGSGPGAYSAACSEGGERNCALSVDSPIAVVDEVPPEIAIDTASK
ncbi:hypothetical protein Sa4125_10800 [Aureimonas sp. SA4125]|nr:hypothetical protein Sa4125_10800 [Aureimonas sp. SA4125]